MYEEDKDPNGTALLTPDDKLIKQKIEERSAGYRQRLPSTRHENCDAERNLMHPLYYKDFKNSKKISGLWICLGCQKIIRLTQTEVKF